MSTTVKLGVKADTSSARKSLRDLDKEVQKMQEKANNRREKQEKQAQRSASVPGFDLGKIETKGIQMLSDQLGKIPVVSGLAQKALQAFAGSAGGLSSILSKIPVVGNLAQGGLSGLAKSLISLKGASTAGLSGLKLIYDGCAQMAAIGHPAAEAAAKLDTSLSTLAKNLGSGNSTAGLTQDIQWLAADGVGNLDQLSQAAKTLMVAFDGNQAAVKHWLPIMDDVAAGTSLTSDQFASMTARVQASGKVETEVFNMLRDRGVPVYQMLAEEMGVTAEQALKLTQNGQVGMKEWMAVVEKMHESYKGLSAELSSKTLEGAQATYEAAKSLAYKGAADAADAQEMARLNAKSAQFKIDAFDQELQTELAAAGQLVGKVKGMMNSVEEAWDDLPMTIARGAVRLLNSFSDLGENIGQQLIAAGQDFRQIPHFAGMSSKQIGEYLTAATDLYKKMEGTIKADTDMEEDTAAKLRASMEHIKSNIEKAEQASKEALEAEQRREADKKAAEKAAAEAAEAKAKADKEAARQAEKERIERARSEEAIKKERQERLKAVKDYAREIHKDEARDAADAAVESGDLDALKSAADKMAQAIGALNMTDALLSLEQLTEKIKNNPEEVTKEEIENHRNLSALKEEVERLTEAAQRQAEDNQEETDRRDADRQELQDAAEAGYNEEKSQQQEDARRKATEDTSLPPDAIAEAAEQYRQELLDSGMSLAEARELFDKWVANQMENAQNNLTTDTHYRDKDGKRILADPEMKNSLKELASQAHSGDILSRRAAALQLKETQEANRLAKKQLAVLSKLNFAPTAQ